MHYVGYNIWFGNNEHSNAPIYYSLCLILGKSNKRGVDGTGKLQSIVHKEIAPN